MNARFNLPPGVTPDDIDPPATRDEDAALGAADHENDIANEDWRTRAVKQQAKMFDAIHRQIFPTLKI